MDAELKREFDRLNKKLNEIATVQRKETWVSAGWISDLTGWDREKLRQAREQKIVEVKRSAGGGWLYKLESIPEQFIKQGEKQLLKDH
jgi:hypothetical protein